MSKLLPCDELVTVGWLWEYAQYRTDDRGYYGYETVITESNPTDHVSPAEKLRNVREIVTRQNAEAVIAAKDARLSKAYSERAYTAVGMARMALALGFKAGIGQDNNEESDPEWRVVLYVDTPNGQVSWHIAPQDQWILDGLPQYDKSWDGTFRSRDGSFAEWRNVETPLKAKLAVAEKALECFLVAYEEDYNLHGAAIEARAVLEGKTS